MLQEADYGVTQNAMNTSNRYIGDETLLVKFFTHPRLMRKESEEAQRPVYTDTAYIQIMQPGNKDSIIQRPARAMDKDRFPEHWSKFNARESQEVEGTRLEEWPMITRSQVEELKYMNVVTVEQLVGMSDANAQGLMGIQLLKQKAVKFLEHSQEEAANAKLEAKLTERDEQIAALMARVEAMENATEEFEEELEED